MRPREVSALHEPSTLDDERSAVGMVERVQADLTASPTDVNEPPLVWTSPPTQRAWSMRRRWGLARRQVTMMESSEHLATALLVRHGHPIPPYHNDNAADPGVSRDLHNTPSRRVSRPHWRRVLKRGRVVAASDRSALPGPADGETP